MGPEWCLAEPLSLFVPIQNEKLYQSFSVTLCFLLLNHELEVSIFPVEYNGQPNQRLLERSQKISKGYCFLFIYCHIIERFINVKSKLSHNKQTYVKFSVLNRAINDWFQENISAVRKYKRG